ncbi:glycosyltransferase family 2 protein [Desulfonatronovibrio magnus]|uniref:glycosyltransferase family 2 protein n=1 Tax=Desulfonatronovibrio magnus TaxID=698827 RepID=UPI0005EB5A81|nr:glycosyltransferase family 2 protein [Desulfonatronovibrio magnus]
MNSCKNKCISFVIPVKDEQDTLNELALSIIHEVQNMEGLYAPEIIFVDDGSKDNSWEIMKNLSTTYKDKVFAIKLRKNFGKATALEIGFSRASGEIVFTMDADLQDDPSEISRFLAELEQGFDMVSGWKRRRNDPFSKTIPSLLFNKVTSFATGIPLHDFNCGFKAYRKEVIEAIKLYGELHRYIPVLAHDYGFRVSEIEVKHHPRKHGISKYGINRYLRGLVDLFTVLATTRWLRKPGHLFGGVGIVSGIIGTGILMYLTVLWFIGLGPIGVRPLFFLGILLCILSVQMISLGIIAEFFIKTSSAIETRKFISEETIGNKETKI